MRILGNVAIRIEYKLFELSLNLTYMTKSHDNNNERNAENRERQVLLSK